ncbi:phosphoenolpyruvate--protein phosphotransferase [Salicibibacter halophilus]|uniref:Phosphoenolpyruvate-protein phosphotransferase n=1 Tax=Salicibibacter halophilus TaxID=2502791 RepID=A0A514LGU7_9BACI|nr:phosphoenolpyruvate--protein phosphotransferase [Salicibibacter halophilus]QDI91076.1 phosphoenolpyruvate--protein phosphotransferase [Salicibibacter halophilus]
MANQLKGIAASSGIAIAHAFLLEQPDLNIQKEIVSDADREITRFQDALDKAKMELETIREKTSVQQGEENAEIFSAHILVLEDPEMIEAVQAKIKDDGVNASFALHEVSSMYIQMFEDMDNAYMQERAADIKDVSQRVLLHLAGVENTSLAAIEEETIILSHDLTPSDTAQLDRQYTLGFVTNIGGRTSHSAIMARSLEIPAVVGTQNITSLVQSGDLLIVDGANGEIVINPDEPTLNMYRERQRQIAADKAEQKKLVGEPSVTAEGTCVELAANIGTPDDMKGVLENGAEGIGLYRTEFLYMGRDRLPEEEEQFEAYRTVVDQMNGAPVVIRTLDIGGDKKLPYLDLPEELNPFLGFRAIRLCLEKTEMFRTQLRALLRASHYGNLKIMFPMVATLEEFRAAKALVEEEKKRLNEAGYSFDEHVSVGIMVEIPSTAVAAAAFAKEVDFFSIGTNDLVQYTLAADRMSERVAHLYQPYHPAVLQLIKNVIDASHAEGKWTGMCGEMAGEETALPLLLGMGLDEFSMSAASILPARSLMRTLNVNDAQALVERALVCGTAGEVKEMVHTHAK